MSYPRQSARTRRFTLGVPRGFQIAPDGSRVVFLRTRTGTDPVTCLWSLDPATGEEHVIADPRSLEPDEADAELPAQERARRERARESAGGIVGYATDRDVTIAAFTLAGRLHVADLRAGTVRGLDAATPVFDPRPDPAGRRVAYVHDRTVRVIDLATGADRVLARPEGEQVSYGLAEFIAAEEMGRMRGHWWAPDGDSLLVARVDQAPVERWFITDPANPARPPAEIAYPAAGTPNADVGLIVLPVDGRPTTVAWDRDAFPYLVSAGWDKQGPLIVVQSRDQRVMHVLSVDPVDGTTAILHTERDPAWVEIVAGVPFRTGTGDLVWSTDDHDSDTRRLTIGGIPVTPAGLQLRSVLDMDGDRVLFTASTEPTEIHVWSYGPKGLARLTEGAGVFSGTKAGGLTVLTGSRPDRPGVTTWVRRPGAGDIAIASLAETPVITPSVRSVRTGARQIRTAVLLPTGRVTGSAPLPVLLDPYGGPHAQRVLAVQRIYCEAQWLADQGFAVVIADGRGTPGRGPAWERAIRGDFAGPVLEDQIAALEEADRLYPGALDLDRVGIRGWSFGGWLAALAVLRRPDVFHAGVAGAPVTDWALYDTHYTERYLGRPEEEPQTYARNSLLDDAPKLERPLMIIHGLADDNVVAAHTLRLSSALLAAGRPHTVLPLSGVTHMTPQEVVAENLLHLQVDFLRRSLAR